jgi:hypothetical protein
MTPPYPITEPRPRKVARLKQLSKANRRLRRYYKEIKLR